jgi:hypothetical protein
MIPDERSQWVIHETRDPACSEAISGEGIGHIVFTTAGIGLENIGEFDPLMAGRTQTDHALAQGEKVEFGLGCGF